MSERQIRIIRYPDGRIHIDMGHTILVQVREDNLDAWTKHALGLPVLHDNSQSEK